MPLVDNRKDGAAYAECFSHIEITGTRFLCFRDVPMLIGRCVSGTLTLDYGCGVGVSSTYLKTLGLDVDGVDINPEMINHAKEKDPTGKYKLIKSAEISADDNCYDLVFSSLVLEEVSKKEELLRIMQEITRVLRAGGTFIAVLPNTDCYNTDWLTVNTEFEENKKLRSGGVVRLFFKDIDLIKCDYYWSEEDYRDIFKEAGLSVVLEHNPLGKDEDGYVWVNEKEKSPFTIYVAKKPPGEGVCDC